jgi:tRNA nucleotidyltransferase/poly(A) polymerase
MALLNRDDGEARVVGGAVRNALMDMPVSDIDIATTLLPQEVVERAEAAGIKTVPTGIDHGTVTLVLAGKPYEVTTLRADVETDGRRAKVAFGKDWKVDAERRDLTINALYAGRTAMSSISSAVSEISRKASSASSATRARGSPKTICGCCASFASSPGTVRAGPRRKG